MEVFAADAVDEGDRRFREPAPREYRERADAGNDGFGGTEHPLVRSDIVFFEYPNRGAVWSVHSINWIEGLSHDSYTNPVSRMTENVLRAFSRDGPLY